MTPSIDARETKFRDRINTDAFANFLLTILGFLLGSLFLIGKDKATPAIFGILLAAFLVSIFLGSISALVLVVLISCFSLATFTSIFRGLFNYPVTAVSSILAFTILIILFTFMFKKIIVPHLSWRLNLIAILISASSLYLLADFRLFRRGGSISALYAWEDNAAWIVTVHRSLNQEINFDGGSFGSLMDTLFWFSHTVSILMFPNLTSPDHLATGVIIATLLLVASIPFLAIMPSIDNTESSSGALTSTLVLSLGGVLGFLQLNSIGHLSAAISCLLLTVYLCISFSLPNRFRSLEIRRFLIFYQVILAYLAGITWWPIAPLSAILIIFSIWSEREIVRKNKKSEFVCFLFTATLLYLLTRRELLQRFNELKSTEGNLASGVRTWMSIVGGNTDTQPWTLLVITLLTLILLALFATLDLKANPGLISFGLVFAYVYSVKFANLRIGEGASAYGSRKLEIVLILIGASFLSWALVIIFEGYLTKNISPLFLGLLTLVFLLSLPVAYIVIPGNYYQGLDWEPNVKTSKLISKNVKVGRSTLCLNETYQLEPSSDLRIAAYVCSRWTSAYSNTDNIQAISWRGTVLEGGNGRSELLQQTSEALPNDTMLIVVGPEDKDRKANNPEWEILVQKEWQVVR
jgi:hypothetical protein